MGHLIINPDQIYLQGWQIEAAHNTQLNLWPPVPVKTSSPYLASHYIPLELNEVEKADKEGTLQKIGGPKVNTFVMSFDVNKPHTPLFRFQVMAAALVDITAVSEAEAIMMGLVSINGFRKGKAKKLIASAWDEMVKQAAHLKYETKPLALCLNLKRVL